MLAGYGPLHFSFQGPNRVIMVDADRVPRPGTYAMANGHVTMWFFDGEVVYHGRMDGSLQTGASIRGMANGAEQWQFGVMLQQGQILPPRQPLPHVPRMQPTFRPQPPAPYEMVQQQQQRSQSMPSLSAWRRPRFNRCPYSSRFASMARPSLRHRA